MRRCSILIVEDEAPLLRALERRFRQLGCDIDIAIDGEMAMKKLRTATYTMVILDLLLPKKHGLNVLKELRAHPRTAKVPVIVLTNYADDNTIRQTEKLGAIDYLLKVEHPIDSIVERVGEIIKKIVKKKR
ncbi:MAG: phoP [Candidatus Magasanikbacteria bacterium]|nr:phoP [Candidatus Magasanikbacteria bacterium]